MPVSRGGMSLLNKCVASEISKLHIAKTCRHSNIINIDNYGHPRLSSASFHA